MRIGYVQFLPAFGEVERNLERMQQVIAAHPAADLLVFPELCTTGYRFQDQSEARRYAQPVPEGPAVEALIDAARRTGTAVVFGMDELEGDALHNTAVLLGPGGYAGRYRKAHLFWDEKDLFRAGDRLEVHTLEVNGERVAIGLLVCFDWAFPEAWRTLALQGAQVVCCPSNLVLPGLAQQAIPAHGLLNRYFTILANRVGTERGLTFTGTSLVGGPRGEVLCQASGEEEVVHLVEVDVSSTLDKLATPRNHILEDRRPELYMS